MATAQLSGVVRQMRAAAFAGANMKDGQLLERYLTRNDEAAFAVLVRRLGPMVLGVCQRVLGNVADAEDAFQATFMVLVRKATVIRPRERIGVWLYGVAYRTALKARCVAAKRRYQETQFARSEAVPATAPDDWRAVLDQELQRLPEKYRTTILLCDLEGKTRKDAAEQLGWADGTLSTRLARARRMLLARLSRRGLALSVAAFFRDVDRELAGRMRAVCTGGGDRSDAESGGSRYDCRDHSREDFHSHGGSDAKHDARESEDVCGDHSGFYRNARTGRGRLSSLAGKRADRKERSEVRAETE